MNWFNKRDNETRDVSFERREAVVESVVETFKDLDKKNCSDKVFVLWMEVDDTIFLDLANITLKLTDCLITKGFDIGKLELRKGKPNGDPMPCKKDERVDFPMYLEIISESTLMSSSQSKMMKARITLAPGSPGSLVRSEGYEIDSEHTPYNIGRVIELGDTTNRINHIEIVDDTHQVSRIHAHIGFAANMFYLQRDKKPGQRPDEKITNRTTITRNDRIENLKNLSSIMSLKDGDIINLSDYISLLFTIKNDNN